MKLTTLIKSILVAGLMTSALTSKADQFLVNGQLYDITAENLVWNNDHAILEANPWWGLNYNDSLAFSQAVGTSLGMQLPGSQYGSNVGPLFVYQIGSGTYAGPVSSGLFSGGYQPTMYPFAAPWNTGSETITYAVGHLVNTNSVPDSGSSMALAGAALLGLAMLRRKFVRS